MKTLEFKGSIEMTSDNAEVKLKTHQGYKHVASMADIESIYFMPGDDGDPVICVEFINQSDFNSVYNNWISIWAVKAKQSAPTNSKTEVKAIAKALELIKPLTKEV